MAEEQKRPLKVFLCHASGDKPVVRALYQRLLRDGVDAWLDKEKLLPGQDWQSEIPKAVRESDAVVVCLSNKSITKEGYVQTEIKFALDIAREKPEGTIFIIPARLEECNVPSQLGLWQWVDLFEPDGYERLMRSLQLRADKFGLRMGDMVFSDRELEQRLDELYTEGLAALWVEDWDKAYHRFQTILREKPDHMQAAAKLEEAKRQKYWNDLYGQAITTYRDENWQAAVELLEKLTREVADYKDVATLLKDAQKKNKLAHLYEEAQRLHKAKQWHAVMKVFSQIVAIEPNYQDPDGLFLSAEKEVAELKRLSDLNDLYRRGVHEIDAGQWYEARELLEQIHKAETGFLETERLLRKVDNEIQKAEELKKRNIEINTLYEQAHRLVRSRNWREALAKIDEIQKLDSQFEDKDAIAEKCKAALEVEEHEIQKENQLAAMYAEAVRLLKEEKYQKALDKWQEVKTVDSKYLDRQWVQRTAQKKLMESSKSLHIKQRFVITKPLWTGVVVLLVVVTATIASLIFFSKNAPPIMPTPTYSPTANVIVSASATNVPTASDHAASTFYEGFDDPSWDGKINPDLWNNRNNCGSVSQQNGGLVFKNSNRGCDLVIKQPRTVRGDALGGLDARLMVSDDHKGGIVTQEIDFFTYDLPGGLWWAFCGILADQNQVTIFFTVGNPGAKAPDELHKSISAEYNQWYVFHLEVDPETMKFSCQVDGKTIGSIIPKDADALRAAQFERLTEAARDFGASGTSYVDYIQILP